ncbi:ectoine utilization protein EutC [Marinivivus vitaminiproducens]|uniref:ectoine utilization protein EutC n=1 Tax=Marinivivus vitaminiproducens TaxID=3035935 RepID=UPI0027A0D811|nr:ectoine utilization protein EutC [Geminicoccaceae bacterium SCSIO 64248]
MPRMLFLTETELRRIVTLDADAVACVEDAFSALATRPVAMPPILRLDIPEHNGEVDVKTAYVPGLSGFAIKVSPGFFDNPKRGLPSLNGMMMLLSAETGLVQALLLDNGYLTAVRTAAAGAVAAKHLSRPDARVAAILGAGEQARLQLRALTLVRPIAEARVWARRAEAAEAMAGEMSAALGIPVQAASSLDAAADGADIVVTTTPATEPILLARHVRPGMHVTAMGSDAEHKNELHPDLVARADAYVPDSLAQVRVLGELRHAIAAGAVPAGRDVPILGAIIAGQAPGRTADDAITIADLTGTGVQDTGIATLAYARALAAGAGTVLEG